jgi:alpha-mannosidase
MNLGRQWDDRLRIWDEAFLQEIYHPAGTLRLDGFTTFERLTLADAKARSFEPFEAGKGWGRKWEYAWVRTRLSVPEGTTGRIWFQLAAGPEMLVFVNGREAGALDKQHHRIYVDAKEIPAEGLEILAEVYAGHGPRLEEAGIVRRGEEAVPEPPEAQCTIGESTWGTVDEEMWQAWLDYHILYDLWRNLPEESARSMKIGAGLQKFTLEADFEAEQPARRESVLAASRGLKPLLDCKNGPSVPDFSVIGQSHLDLAWLWTLNETHRKVARTYSNQLALMERFPEYKFILCEPILMDWMKAEYPDLYERVKEKVKSGQMIPEGAVYVEGDMNLPGGESLTRQFIYGKRWFRKELGVDSRLAWMPDTFGYSAALPQIMKGCGVDYFSTQKMMRQDPECDPFPFHNFWWEGLDGSRVLSHMYKECNAKMTPAKVLERWNKDRIPTEEMDGFLYPFGFGDGGGGATEEQVESARRMQDLEGLPRMKMESPIAFYEHLEEQGVRNVYYGEIYLAWHRGTLTSQARVKRGMRRAEEAVREAEYLAGLLRLAGKSKDKEPERLAQLERLWKELLLDEFHDILPGTGIEQVVKEAEESLKKVRTEALELAKQELRELAEGDAVFNSLPWEREVSGAKIPACGYRKLGAEVHMLKTAGPVTVEALEDGAYRIENAFYTAVLAKDGVITSYVDRKTGFEHAAAGLNRFRMFRDVNGYYDAWELSKMYEDAEETLSAPVIAKPEETEEGVTVRLTLKEQYFTLEQEILFRADTPRVDFNTKIDWHERHRILKVDFGTGIFTRESVAETQYGYLKRPTHRSRAFDRDRYETACQRYVALTDGENGLAVLNDGKYGYSAKDSSLALTLLKAPVFPDGHADQGMQEANYSILPFTGPIGRSEVLQEAWERNLMPTATDDKVLQQATGESVSFFHTEGGSAVIDICKPAFDGENAVVLRLYEAAGSACRTKLHLPTGVKAVSECNLLEEDGKIPEIRDGAAELSFRPFEIKTLRMEF